MKQILCANSLFGKDYSCWNHQNNAHTPQGRRHFLYIEDIILPVSLTIASRPTNKQEESSMNERIARLSSFVLKEYLYLDSVPVEYDRCDLFLSDLRRDTKRLCEYMLAQPVCLREDMRLTGFFYFDGSVPSDLFPRTGHKRFQEFRAQFYNKPLENLCTFEWQHSTADFAYVVQHGMKGYLDRISTSRTAHDGDERALEYLDCTEQLVNTIIELGKRNAAACRERAAQVEDETYKADLLLMAETFDQVPAGPALTFRQGIQTVAMCFTFLSDCIGLIDRYLYPLFRADLDAGRLTMDEAKELLQELYIDICAHTGPKSANADRSAESHFAIGGYLPDHSDGFNELSRLIVDSLMEMPINKPQITLRWTRKLPFETFKYILDCERHDALKRIAVVSDEPRISSFMKHLSLSWEDACNYTMVGCNEPSLPGGIWLGGCTSNIARSLENLLHNRTDELIACRSFDEVYALYEQELTKDVNRIVEISDGFNRARSRDTNVLSSIFLDGCIENARSVTQGGARLALSGSNIIGMTCVIDSLAIISQFVFEEKAFTMTQLLNALTANWEGHEFMRALILKKGRFFGNNDPVSDEIARRFTSSLEKLLAPRRNLFGNPFLLGCLAGYNPHYVWFGQNTGATPDGRMSGEAFMVGAGQISGKDRNGLTALLNSVAQMDPNGILCGPFVCNLMLDETLIRNDSHFDKTARMLESYFQMGGLHAQLNYVSREELLDAQAHPEKYGNLRVRVSGFSGTFTLLQESVQDEIVSRTSQR